MTKNGYFTLNSVFVKLKFKIYLFTYMDIAMVSKGHIYACAGRCAESLYHRYFYVYLWFVSLSQVNVFTRATPR